jgi:F-type H+-transporting ATPase subunit b
MSLTVTMIAQAIMFFVFIFFCARFIWPWLMKQIEARQKTIADGLAAAERGRQDLEQASKQTAQMLAQTRQQAQEIIGQADRRAAQLLEEAKVMARTEGERLVAGAKAEIQQEVSRAKEALRTQVAALAVAGAEQILKREVDAKAHAEMLRGVQSQL